ncbi:hypothetical protein EYF80_033713 [Liparis tanakae]|uniref:Uncharacterized protein n=1 Tax=Liparis tanakae TaxID=230148 RepID=A0A4Z2GTM7_9TELE|nr:hypothetical protein EYF80_033713 [Liparis tanakae]
MERKRGDPTVEVPGEVTEADVKRLRVWALLPTEGQKGRRKVGPGARVYRSLPPAGGPRDPTR